MVVEYQIWYRWGNNREELKSKNWISRACFSNLKYKLDPQPVLFEARFKNQLDNINIGYSTIKWLEEFKLSNKAHKGIVSVSVTQNYYYVVLDMSILSYEWAFSILTLFRYPGEYYNICWNYWKIREKYPALDKWESLYLAHQGSFAAEYKNTFGYSFSYNSGHTIFKPGQRMSSLNIENTFKRMDKVIPYTDEDAYLYPCIQDLWGGEGYIALLNFDKDIKNTHVDKELE